MKRTNSAFKGWKSCMDGFTSEEESIKHEANLQFTPECDSTVEILWSSSSDEESAKVKSKRKKVVTRLNFDECISHTSGHATPLYSRHLEDVETVDRESTCRQSLNQDIYGTFGTPKKEHLMLPADVNLPSSPVIMRRKRRRSLHDAPVSPIIERKFMKKIRKMSPDPVNSPGNFVKYRFESRLALDNSMSGSSVDMNTPLKEDENFQTTSITPVLESMNLNSLRQKSKNVLTAAGHQSIMATTPPIIEAATSQDILEITGSDDIDQIREPNDSQVDAQIGLESDGLPLSAVITLSASPSITTDAMQENGEGNLDPGFAVLPLSAETPHKNAFSSMDDPESGGKRKRLKKGGLAMRLQRLLNRQQSWQRMWQHEQMGKSNSNSELLLLLSVKSLWTEAAKILVQCRVESKPELSKGQFVMEHVILLLNPVTIGEIGIKPGCIIRIHPPWQSLQINSSTTLLIGANLLKAVSPAESRHLVEIYEKKFVTKSYDCPCIDGESCITFDKECPFRLELGGLEFLSKIMPSLIRDSNGQEKKGHLEPQLLLTQLPPSSETKHVENEIKRQGTISQVVAAHSQRDGTAVCGSFLIAVVQRVFCYRAAQQSSVSAKRSLSLAKTITQRWSALLQDGAGEFCEVEFESQPEVLSLDKPNARGEICDGPWWGITYVGKMLCEGAILCISGLRILKRSEGNRPRGLSAIIQAIHNERKIHVAEEGVANSYDERLSGQMFVYTFSYQKGGSLERLNETAFQLPAWSKPLVQTLYDVLHEWKRKDTASRSSEGQRITVLVKVLFALTSGQDAPWRMFVSDPSLQEIPHWVPVSIKPTCSVSPLLASMPFNPFSSAAAPVICLQDAELCGGELMCDRFSHVHADGGQSSLPTWMASHAEVMAFIRSSPLPHVPQLKPDSVPGDVVSVMGNVIGVDEETAYSWPACKFCGNDHLSKGQHPSTSEQQPLYYCFQCKTSFEKPLNKMSLDAYIACNSLPPECCRIKIKMCQKSITDLLPQEEGKMGYELTSVLGKLIGPLFCVLSSTYKSPQQRRKDDVMFVLEELVCFVNIQ